VKKKTQENVFKVYFSMYCMRYITKLVFSHIPVAIEDLLHPGGHVADQVLQEIALRCPLQPHLQNCSPSLLLRVDSDFFNCFLMSLRGTLAFQSSNAALLAHLCGGFSEIFS
jgi:hypothetical protein